MPFITEVIYSKLCSLISNYPKIIDSVELNDDIFENILGLPKICRAKENVTIENFDEIGYLKSLAKTNFVIVDKLFWNDCKF